MDVTYTRPKLRWPLDIRMHNLGGQEALVIQCPLGVSANPLCLMPQFAPIVVQLDGNHTSEEIVQKFSPQGLTPELLRDLIKHLDDHLFIANSRFFAAEKMMRDNFERSPVRPAALVGAGYPATAGELGMFVENYLQPFEVPAQKRHLSCLVAPHIDYRRGGACYGAIYPRLKESDADTYILIGTAHQYSRHMFHLCAKDFESPMGRHSCDREFVTELSNRYGIERSFADQYLHRREHSLELQLPFLSAVKPGVSVVPILVGGFHEMVEAQRYPNEWESYESFAGALSEILARQTAQGSKIAFLAGVDMAHMGRAFGDQGSLTPEKMQQIGFRDHEYLRALELGDKKMLFDHIAQDQDARRICGFPTMYLVLDVLDRIGYRGECEIVQYDQAVDYESDCAVTYAGVVMYKNPSNLLISQSFVP